jgi:hypothetical protein
MGKIFAMKTTKQAGCGGVSQLLRRLGQENRVQGQPGAT